MDISTHVTRGDTTTAAERLAALRDAPTGERKAALRRLRTTTDDDPSLAAPLVEDLVPFLIDEDRSVRLSTAKLLTGVAEAAPSEVLSVSEDLADRLAAEDEFYYVRARCAEALGHVAVDRPDEVASPTVLADLRVGLAFDEPEVRVKLAKALEHVAHGDPDRLRHQVAALSEHLDDDEALVRYHLLTAVTVIACVHPGRVAGVRGRIADRLNDDEPVVRGRAAEALGVLPSAENESPDSASTRAPETFADRLIRTEPDDEPFLAERLEFARAAFDGTVSDREFEGIGSTSGIRATTAAAVDAITTPDGAECPHCGNEVPTDAPICPICGSPH